MELEIYRPCIKCMFRDLEVVQSMKSERDVFGEYRLVERDLELCSHAPVCKFIDGETKLADDEGGEVDG